MLPGFRGHSLVSFGVAVSHRLLFIINREILVAETLPNLTHVHASRSSGPFTKQQLMHKSIKSTKCIKSWTKTLHKIHIINPDIQRFTREVRGRFLYLRSPPFISWISISAPEDHSIKPGRMKNRKTTRQRFYTLAVKESESHALFSRAWDERRKREVF